jgi:hypothetical protein
VHWAVGVRLQVRRAVGVRREVVGLHAAWVRLEVHQVPGAGIWGQVVPGLWELGGRCLRMRMRGGWWEVLRDARCRGQAGGVSGCLRRGQAGGAWGCARRGSGEKCLWMHVACFKRDM